MPQRYLLDYVHSSHRSTEDTLRPSKTQQTDGHMNSESLKQRAQGMHRYVPHNSIEIGRAHV